MNCPIFKAMKSGFCLNENCHYWYPEKGKDDFCKYTEVPAEKKASEARARAQRQTYKKLVGKKDVQVEQAKERKEKDIVCEK